MSCTIPQVADQTSKPGPGLDYSPELVELFDALVNVIFCVKDPEGRYLVVNNAFVRRTGRSSKRDVVGRRAIELFHEALAERYEEQDAKILQGAKPLHDELELIARTGGSLGWYLTTKIPVLRAGAVSAIVSVSRDLDVAKEETVEIESLTRVVTEVGQRLAESVKVAALAEVAHCTEKQLESRVKRVFGVTVTQYVLQRRVERATRLLTESDLALAEIATQCGFYDQANFTRRFARLTNSTPAQFRRQHVISVVASSGD